MGLPSFLFSSPASSLFFVLSTSSSSLSLLCLAVMLGVLSPRGCEAHGRLIDPASRGSAFRFGFDNPSDWNDNAGVGGGHSSRRVMMEKSECAEIRFRDPFCTRLVASLPMASSQKLTAK